MNHQTWSCSLKYIGGAAYVCELSIGDEVLSMNGMTVAILSQDQIVEAGFLFFSKRALIWYAEALGQSKGGFQNGNLSKLMTEAVRTGQLRLRVRRYPRAARKSIIWD